VLLEKHITLSTLADTWSSKFDALRREKHAAHQRYIHTCSPKNFPHTHTHILITHTLSHLAAALLLKNTARCLRASMFWGSLLATSSVKRKASVKHSSASTYSPLEKCLLPSSFFLAACFCSSVSFLALLTTVRLTEVLSSSARMGSGASGCDFLVHDDQCAVRWTCLGQCGGDGRMSSCVLAGHSQFDVRLFCVLFAD
jgi:hypothetical protein